MRNPIDIETTDSFSKKTNTDKHVRSARNATFRNDLLEVAMNWDQ